MIDILNYIIDNIYQFLGVVFSIVYVMFSIKQNILCWHALIIASILNMFAYNLIDLPLQVVMQLFFIGTAIYGWYNWHQAENKGKLKVKSWDTTKHIKWVSFGLLITCVLTILLKELNLNSNYPFLDSLMFVFNIIPMYLTGKKVLESWIYFILIDIVSGLFYLITNQYFFCFLFFCYIGFAISGYKTWKKHMT